MALALAGTTRVQVHTASAQRDAASAQAAGEAAVALALQELLAQPVRLDGVQHMRVQWQDMDIAVQVASLDGFVSLNGASVEMLATVLQSTGAANAQTLAEAIVAWRDGTDMPLEKRLQPRRFEAVEDLMLVSGMDYALYARVAPLMSATAKNSAVNARSAPSEVLHAFAGEQDARVDDYMARRDEPNADASFLNPAFATAHGGGGTLYRVSANVPLDEGTIAHFVCDVALQADTQRGQPWTLLRQSVHVAAPPPRS